MQMRKLALTAPLTAAAALVTQIGFAQQNDQQNNDSARKDETPESTQLERCVRLPQIDHTDVVDDNTILFYMRDGTILRNNLPQRCPDLKGQDRFMYRVTLPSLCDVDVITVLNNIGPGFMPGASCGLGKFQPISKEAADEIKQVAERSGKDKRG
jgi:hypothetical protein